VVDRDPGYLGGELDIVKKKFDATSPRLGVTWSPISDFAIRASWGESFRAPVFTDLFTNSTFGFTGRYFDPLAPGGPATVFVPISFRSNPDVQPEKSDSYALGFDWQPSSVPGLRWTLDWSKVDFEDRIVHASSLRFSMPPEEFAAIEDIVIRDPAGNVTELDLRPVNQTARVSEILTTDISYTFSTGYGTFIPGLNYSKILSEYDQFTPESDKVDNVGTARGNDEYNIRAIWGETNPAGNIWSVKQVEGLNREDLLEFHTHAVTPVNTTVYMVGDVKLKEAKKALYKAFGNWKSKKSPGIQPIGKALPSKPQVILVDQPGAAQSNVVVGHAIAPFDAATDTELSVMNGVFGGAFEARINMNLREDKGWSYGILSRVGRNASGDQVLYVSGGVQTDKTMESMIEIKREFEEFISSRPGTQAELDREILNRTRSIPGNFDSSHKFLSSMTKSDHYGLSFDYAEGEKERLQKVKLEGINERARQLVRPDQLTWVIVGDLSEIEEKVRSLDYGEVEVWDSSGNRLR